MNEKEQVWVDGNRLKGDHLTISPFSETLLYGRGLFETMALRDGVLRFWEFHLDRLYGGGGDLGFDMPPREQLTTQVRNVLQRANLTDGRIRLLLFHRGKTQSPGVLLYLSELPRSSCSSVRLLLSNLVRSVPPTRMRRKTTSYLDELVAQREAIAAGAFDVVLLSGERTVAEGSRSNIFIRLEGSIRTPPVSTGLLPGVGRRGVLSGAAELGIAIEESDFNAEELLQAEEVVVVNALRGVCPVAQIAFGDGEEFVDYRSQSPPLSDVLGTAFAHGWLTTSLRVEV